MATDDDGTVVTQPNPTGYSGSQLIIIPMWVKIEEERLPYYSPQRFYPVRMFEVFRHRYRVVGKLGFGTRSTTWLCRDLACLTPRWVALKIHINTLSHNKEIRIDRYLKALPPSNHAGQHIIRMLEDSFQVRGNYGIHDVLTMKPLGASFEIMRQRSPDSVLPRGVVRLALQQVIPALDYFHNVASITFTDFHAGNILVGVPDRILFDLAERTEYKMPSARKDIGSAIIYQSRYVTMTNGPVYLCDLAEARIGTEHEGYAMPIPYRAPEILLDMEWGPPVDMWSVALTAWDLIEPEVLFRIYDIADGGRNEAIHLANMVALMGPPPKEFLARSKKTRLFWDAEGNWICSEPIPTERTLESLVCRAEGDERTRLLGFMRGLLCWLPEKRMTTEDAYIHPWVRGYEGPVDVE